MKRLAQLENSIVVNIIVADDSESESASLVAYTDANPAYIGGDYHEGLFYPPRPFSSWLRDAGEWVPPVPRPEEGRWDWDEDTLAWVALT